MIEFFGNLESSEGRAARVISDLFIKNWPDINEDSLSIIKIYAGAKLFGYQVQDIDVIIICNFENPKNFAPTRPLITNPNDEAERKEIIVESIVICIEVKDHDSRFIKFEGDSVFVNYKVKNSEGWHSASDQNLAQAHSLKQYLFDEYKSSPFVSNLIYLSNLEEADIPKRPNNIITPTISPRDFLTVIAETSKPYRRKNNKTYLSSSNEEKSKIFINSSIFKRYYPSTLDRKKLDAISKKEGFDSKWPIEVGKRLLTLRGRAGTGKTIALLQLAHFLFEKKNSRILLLTYNLTLLGEIRRLVALLGLTGNIDDGGVKVESCMAYFYKILKSFALIPDNDDFLSEYPKLISELNGSFENNIFNSNDVLQVLNKSPEVFLFDYIFIDESQDWFPDEIKIIKHIYGSENLVIADGMDQLVRGSRSLWSEGLKEQQKIVFSLDSALRMKSNLVLFVNNFSKFLGVSDWSIKLNDHIKGGKVEIIVCPLSSALFKVNAFIKEAITQKNQPVDLLMLLTPELSLQLSNESSLKLAEEQIGCKIWPGFQYETRKELPDNINAIRAIKYQSARGLEGWTTFCLNFDQYYINLINHLNSEYNSLESKVLSRDEWVASEANRWLLMIFTRSIDTIVIHFENKNSVIYQTLESFSKNYPDYIYLDA